MPEFLPKPPTPVTEKELTPEGMSSVDLWYQQMVGADEISAESADQILGYLKQEIPALTSVTFERFCNLQCTHCIYPAEPSTRALSDKFNLGAVVESIVTQMPTENDPPHFEKPVLVHEGRVLLPWHINVLKKVRTLRPDMMIGLIDNGTFRKFLKTFNEDPQFRLDWIDISIDGMERAHNLQRDPGHAHPTAFSDAVAGLESARQIVKPGGEVNSLMTLTNVNFQDVEAVADFLLSPRPGAPIDAKTGEPLSYADNFVVTTMSPARPPLAPLEFSPNYLNTDGRPGDVAEMRSAWEQIKKVCAKYNKTSERVTFRLYRHQDLEKLAYVIGAKKFWHAFTTHEPQEHEDGVVGVDIGRIVVRIDGISVLFSPLSTWPQETFLVDADATARLAYSLKHTVEELRAAMDAPDTNEGGEIKQIKNYTVDQLVPTSDRTKIFQKGAEQWWNNFGRKFLSDERDVFKRISAEAARE